jgi:6-pyruvoyltetrahydropterin/6-carboxytetrahydropterin synthase
MLFINFAQPGDSAMYEVEIILSFSAAHRLRDYNGKCEQLHGHNYKVQIAARAPSPGKGGMVIDFTELKKAAGPVLEKLDHKYLNDIKPFDEIEPSAENIAAHIFHEISEQLGDRAGIMHSVTVWESDTSRACYIKDFA